MHSKDCCSIKAITIQSILIAAESFYFAQNVPGHPSICLRPEAGAIVQKV